VSRAQAAVFCHTTLTCTPRDGVTVGDLRGMLEALRAREMRLIVFSNDRLSPSTKQIYMDRGFPDIDLFLNAADVGKNKGSHLWVETAAKKLGIEPHAFFYVGDDDRDWHTAINTPIMYLQANWSKQSTAKMTCIEVATPRDVVSFVDQFLARPARFAFTLDDEATGLHLRSLFPQGPVLVGSPPHPTFDLLDLLHRRIDVQVGNMSAQSLLMFHLVSSLNLLGEIERAALWTVYPSSDPASPLKPVEAFLGLQSKTAHGYFKEDLIVRGRRGRDTSRARYYGEPVSMDDQLHTVHLNPAYQRQIRNKQVIVFDDFTTSGRSLELARNLLLAAGASKVILLAAGKYREAHTQYLLKPNVTLNPFALETRGWMDVFETRRWPLTRDPRAILSVTEAFAAQKAQAE